MKRLTIGVLKVINSFSIKNLGSQQLRVRYQIYIIYINLGGIMMDLEEISFQIILYGGNARSLALEAMKHAKVGEFDEAEAKIVEAKEQITTAHRYQTNLIQGEARGEKTEIRLLLIHAQDHLMNAMTVMDLSGDIIELYKR